MIRKIVILFILIFFFMMPKTYATDEIISSQMEALNMSSVIKEGQAYTKEVFPDININELLNSAIKGKVDNKGILKDILSLFGSEIKSSLSLIGSILVVVLIHSILKGFSDNLNSKGVSQTAFYVEYILIVTIVMANFSDVISLIKETISNLVGFATSLIPILLALMVASGNIVSNSFIQPVILFSVVFISNAITLFILPIMFIGIAISIVSNLSDKIQIDKLSKFLKSGISWILITVVTIFVSILSLEGTLTSNIDGITAKGIKSVSNLVPIVGKALGESVDMVAGATSVLKNSIGIVGMIIIIGICIIPVVKLTLLTLTYYFTCAICEPLADKKIVGLLEQIGGTFKVLLGIMVFVGVLLIVGIAMCIKISNTGMMYR